MSPATLTCTHIEPPFWDEIFTAPGFSGDSVDIWKWDVVSNRERVNEYLYLVDERDREKADRYRLSADKERFIAGKIISKILLGKYTGLQPAAIIITPGINKKPQVDNKTDPSIHFNLSHSGDFILLAIGNSPVGIDLEKIDTSFFFEDILASGFDPGEIEFVKRADSPVHMFYRLWTRKESFLKAIGKGMSSNLASIPSIDGRYILSAALTDQPEPLSWNVTSFTTDNRYVASVARPDFLNKFRFFNLSDLNAWN